MARDLEDDTTHPFDGEGDEESAPFIDAQIQQLLGRVLSQCTEDLLRQPIPDSFLALLARLEARERKGG
jgi:hypothetical protein